MPLVQITLLEGRDSATVTQCAKDVAQTIHAALGAPLPSIRVIVTQVPSTQWIIGARSAAELAGPAAGEAGPCR